MKADKPHGQWLVLQALTRLPPFGVTDIDVFNETIKFDKISFIGTQSRLSELRTMCLVSWRKFPGEKRSRYFITEIGWRLSRMGTDGPLRLRILRTSAAALEKQRAIELAPIKERWDRVIRNQMKMITLGVIPDAE